MPKLGQQQFRWKRLTHSRLTVFNTETQRHGDTERTKKEKNKVAAVIFCFLSAPLCLSASVLNAKGTSVRVVRNFGVAYNSDPAFLCPKRQGGRDGRTASACAGPTQPVRAASAGPRNCSHRGPNAPGTRRSIGRRVLSRRGATGIDER